MPHSELNPDEVVALGAAVQADILAGGTTHMLLLDVTPLSLGIETLGGAVSVLIPRNTTIPTSANEAFTTSVDGQSIVDMHVVQGERDLAKDNRSLARFDLSGIPPMPAGLPRIEVTFLIDANGILGVTAKEVRSGTQASVEVRPTYGLSECRGRADDRRVARARRGGRPGAKPDRRPERSRHRSAGDREGAGAGRGLPRPGRGRADPHGRGGPRRGESRARMPTRSGTRRLASTKRRSGWRSG